jgi:putative endonuclease
MFYVYYLESLNNDFRYVGFTSDLKKRLEEHNSCQNKSTKAYAPYKVIFYEAYLDVEDARRRENYLKTTAGREALRKMLKCYNAKARS